MEKTFAKVEELIGSIKDYVNTRIKSLKLNIAEKSSIVISNVLAGMVVAIMFLFFIIFASTALAFALGNLIGNTWSGFLIVAGLYLLAGMIIWRGREKILRLPIMNALIKKMFRNDEEEEI